MGNTTIEWTDKTWSPLRVQVKHNAGEIATESGYKSLVKIATKMAGHVGPHCERVSHGCNNCYSDSNNGRCLPSNGTGLPFDRRSRDLVEPFVDEKILLQPLEWKRPVRIFVENQSDLFGEWVTDEQVDHVFAVMMMCQRHTFQVLTKRPERMLEYFRTIPFGGQDGAHDTRQFRITKQWSKLGPAKPNWNGTPTATLQAMTRWPLSNVWLGISCESQPTAEKRTAILRQIPAAIRFISQEPQIAEIDWRPGMLDGIGWLVQGGESGRGARDFHVEWAQKTSLQCAEANVSYFLKQIGAKPIVDGELMYWIIDRKGGDMDEWPQDLRVRQFPGDMQPCLS